MRLLAASDMPKVETRLTVDISSLVGSTVFLWLVQALLPLSLSLLVYEKEKRCALVHFVAPVIVHCIIRVVIDAQSSLAGCSCSALLGLARCAAVDSVVHAKLRSML